MILGNRVDRCIVHLFCVFRNQIKELELGDQFPDIRSLTVHNVQLDDAEQRIENLDLLLDINYIGNFSTSIDADMVLGKKGSIMLKGNVTHI